jgi:peptidoglycan-N-acetylglucosamine deacetylase
VRPLCSISIDLDPLPCYYRIHGLGPAPDGLRHVIMQRCVERFADVLAPRGICATFFVVAEELEQLPAAHQLLRDLVAAGHELANHSYSHPYDLARRPRSEIAREVSRAHDLISAVANEPVVGFRGPGYDVSTDLLGVLIDMGYRYDSSLLPAPAYYAAKAAVMAVMRLRGRTSGAVLTEARALLAPIEPFRPQLRAPWRTGEADIVELPIAVTPGLRAPVIGNVLLLAPSWLRSQWLRAVARRWFFNFELHGIDLADAELDGIPAPLIARQPELAIPLPTRRQRLLDVLAAVARSHDFVPLAGAARAASLRMPVCGS